ncbi:MAG: hypothetical protein ACI9T9_000349 [Oleiphilaceae bacterium]|jgi:hypothetical protein
MKKGFIFSLFILCLGCTSNEGDPIRSSSATSSITITSVLPLTVYEDANTEFTITIEYQLVDSDEGEIGVNFNLDGLSKFSPAKTEVISRGEDSITIKASAIPVIHEPNGSFAIFVSISEFPHLNPWTPLDSDTWNIKVTPKIGVSTSTPMTVDEPDIICYTDHGEQCIQY